jgi:hypothetical protein
MIVLQSLHIVASCLFFSLCLSVSSSDVAFRTLAVLGV